MSRLNEWGQPIGPALPTWRPPPEPPRAELSGRYALLRPLASVAAGSALFEAFSADADARRWTYLPYGPFATRELFEAWLEGAAARSDPLFYAILDRSSSSALGLCSYLRIAPDSGSIEVGHLNFSSALQRSPIATEAMYLMMRNAFELGYRRYEWKCDALNAPSRAAATRLGFAYEGTFRNAAVYKGRSRDTAWYSVIDSEWPALRRAFERWLAPDNFDPTGAQRVPLSELTHALRGEAGARGEPARAQ